MRRKTICIAALTGCLIFIFLPVVTWGNGFYIFEQGAKAVGMGGAFTAQADDPSAIYYNAAGIMQLEGTQVMMGASAISPTSSFVSDGNVVMGTTAGQSTTAKDRTWLIPHFYLTHKINDKVAVGLGTFANFGLGTEWPVEFEGRYTAGAGRAFIKTFSINPVIAVKPLENLSVSFGPNYQYMDLEMRTLAFTGLVTPPLAAGRNLSRTVEAGLSGTDWAWGWTMGFLYNITKEVSFGASYLSEVRHHLDGIQQVIRQSDGVQLRRQGAGASISTPAIVNMGLAYKPGPWTFEVDAQWTEWSSYDELFITYENGSVTQSVKNWRNAWAFRLGSQYRLNRYVDLRAGIVWDESPVPRETLDPMVPSGNRWLYCLGLGLHATDRFTVDLAYSYLQDQERRWDNSSGDVRIGSHKITRVSGQFKDTSANIFSLTASYRF